MPKLFENKTAGRLRLVPWAMIPMVAIVIVSSAPPPREAPVDPVESAVRPELPRLEVEGYFAEGPFAPVRRLIARKDARATAELIKRLLERYPNAREAPPARYLLGLSLLRMGAFDEAQRLFAVLATSYPELRDDHLFLRGEALYLWGNYLDAADALGDVDPEGPRGDEARRLRAWALLGATAFDRLAAWLGGLETQGERLDPELMFILGRARHRTGDPAGAYRAFESVWRDSPGGRLAGAALVELVALRVDGRPMLSRFELSAVRALSGRLLSGRDVDGALRSLEDRLRRASSSQKLRSEIAYVRGRIAEGAGRITAARVLYGRALSLAPERERELRARVALREALTVARLGDRAGALARYQLVADRYMERPEAEEALHEAAEILLATRRYGEAQAMMEALLVKNPVTRHRARCLLGMGWTQLRLGEYDRAREFFSALTNQSLSREVDASARYWLARSEALLGNSDAAEAGFRDVIERHPLSHYAALAEAQTGGSRETLEPAPLSQSGAEDEPPPEPREFGEIREYVRLGLRDRAARALSNLEASLGSVPPRDASVLVVMKRLYEDIGRADDARRLRVRIERERPPSLDDRAFVAAQRRILPLRFERAIHAAAGEFRLSEALLFALVRTESGFRPSAVSSVNALGLTQLVLPTAEEVAARLRAGKISKVRLLQDTTLNVRLGAAYLRTLLDRYRGSAPLALMAYNAGPSAVDRWLLDRSRPTEGSPPGREEVVRPRPDELVEELPAEETRAFVKNVLSRARGYALLYPKTSSGKLATDDSPRQRRALGGSVGARLK